MTSRGVQIGLGLLIVAIVLVMAVRAQDGSDDGKAVAADKARQALRELPYRYEFRAVSPPEGAESAIAGTAIGPHGGALHFGAAFGDSPRPVSVSQSGRSEALTVQGAVITTDVAGKDPRGKRRRSPPSHTAEQRNEAAEMSVQIADKLCQTATGKPCPEGDIGQGDGGEDPPAGKSKPVFRTIDQGPLPE